MARFRYLEPSSCRFVNFPLVPVPLAGMHPLCGLLVVAAAACFLVGTISPPPPPTTATYGKEEQGIEINVLLVFVNVGG